MQKTLEKPSNEYLDHLIRIWLNLLVGNISEARKCYNEIDNTNGYFSISSFSAASEYCKLFSTMPKFSLKETKPEKISKPLFFDKNLKPKIDERLSKFFSQASQQPEGEKMKLAVIYLGDYPTTTAACRALGIKCTYNGNSKTPDIILKYRNLAVKSIVNNRRMT